MRRWRYLPRMLPWLMRFVAASASGKVAAQAAALRALLAPAFDAYVPLVARLAPTVLAVTAQDRVGHFVTRLKCASADKAV